MNADTSIKKMYNIVTKYLKIKEIFMPKEKGHLIGRIDENSIAEELNIEPGDKLLKINDQEITDIFDYQYLVQDEHLDVLILKQNGEEWLLDIDKDYYEDLGIEFENGLMDNYRRCSNNCIFCFIDQMPKGMRDTLYFKDDDSRLSFLQGNYVTLTNMSDADIDRILKYHLSPINVSFQTTNPELRCKMLGNRFAGEALKKVDRLCAPGSGIELNGQIVLCKGVNDGAELERSIRDMSKYIPNLQSVSVVPVGLSKYRDGLYPLEPFDSKDAAEVIDLIESWQRKIYDEHGIHFIHASDEWYFLAGRPFPEADRYDGYIQLENGVGMVRLLIDEFDEALEVAVSEHGDHIAGLEREISLATGRLVYPCIKELVEKAMKVSTGLKVHVYEIINEFFGERITVSGLLTGQDIIKQLKGRELGSTLYLPENLLRSGEDYLLDDVRIGDIEKALDTNVGISKCDGHNLVSLLLDIPEDELYKG
ncbi:Fe-S oxidoreductase [Butyrivibrio hungatei]|uniref:Fe-S oxidoreductase n=2 Tax=Butyrivibrio hungatei TaxID=185008 RepID=A0A1D9P1S2_9FIRM|nr:Fe-S oxidoreductase [Butyrivibrio hungatei]